MGDLANMTDCDGRVNGPRLLRWLRSRAEMYRRKEEDARVKGYVSSRYSYCGRAVVLEEMAGDLESELTPPGYPGDDDDTVDLDNPALNGGPEDDGPEMPGTIMYRRHGVLYSIVPWPESIANPHGYGVAVIRGGEVVGGAVDGAAVIYGMRDGLWDVEKEQRS